MAGFRVGSDEVAATAWVNFNGAGGGIRDSFNVSSIADGTPAGEHVVNFATTMGNANYCVTTAVGWVANGNGPNASVNIHRYSSTGNESAPSTGGFRVGAASNTGTSADMAHMNVAVFGGI